MTTFPGCPRTIKYGIVLIDPLTSKVIRIIALQEIRDVLMCTL